jgi:hypothetical protein
MAVTEILLTTAGGALSATIGVMVGGMVTRRAQDRHWLRDKQLAAYQELLRHYATFAMVLKRAHWAKSGWDYDWAVWSAALTHASLVAPREVAEEIDRFGTAIGVFLSKASVDTRTSPLSEAEFEEAMVGPAQAQMAFVNAVRRSLGRELGAIPFGIGGSLPKAPWRDRQGQV